MSTRTLQGIHSCLNRSVKRAMARDKVKRNVVTLASAPQGTAGRPSKSLTLKQAMAVLRTAETSRLYPYLVVSLLTGARTEEMRALTWADVDLVGDPKSVPPIPPFMAVWRSVRRGGDTKTRTSRRTIALPSRCVDVLKRQRRQQAEDRPRAGEGWKENDLVFASKVGTPLDASHVRRDLRRAIKGAEGANADDWTARELRHSFVSLLSGAGVPLDDISRLVGHSATAVTEQVYRHQIRPVIQTAAITMDSILGADRASS